MSSEVETSRCITRGIAAGFSRTSLGMTCENKMKFSVNWLREFVDLPKNPEEIAELLTRAGIETKNIETRGANIDKVIVSQITASSRHPNADRLTSLRSGRRERLEAPDRLRRNKLQSR